MVKCVNIFDEAVHMCLNRTLSPYDENELHKAKKILKNVGSPRDLNGFPFSMTRKEAKIEMRRIKGVFWRFHI
jgi:hypothetical protein